MRFFILCVCLFNINHACAVIVPDLYQVEVAVADQKDSSRNAGVREAFKKLLIKISGSDAVLNNPLLMSAQNNPEAYLQGYTYHKEASDSQISIQLWFSKELVLPLMKKANATIWGENRPLLLSWLVVEAPNKTIISKQMAQWQAPFENAFDERGIPLLWPSIDSRDKKSLSVNALWSLSSSRIKTASTRYNSDAVLAGKLFQNSNGTWKYTGVLTQGLQNKTLSVSGNTSDSVLTALASNVSQYFADQFAIKSNSMNGQLGVRISVKKIKDFTDYSKVLAYLESLTGVDSVEVSQVDNEDLQLYLNLEGSWDKVQKTINLDNKLSTVQEKEFEWMQ